MRPSRNTLLIQALALELKVRRTELGMTQEDLAAATSLDRPFLTLIEAAKKQPSLSVFWRIADGLRLSASQLAAKVDKRAAAMQIPPTEVVRKRLTTKQASSTKR